MTAPTPEKIERWEKEDRCAMAPDKTGNWVFYPDHLRHLKLAQIEALESITYLFKHSDGIEELEAKIAALRKELEG